MSHAYLNTGPSDFSLVQFCTKKPFLNLKSARRQLSRGINHRSRGLVAMGSGVMSAYRCSICGAYHVGHRERQ